MKNEKITWESLIETEALTGNEISVLKERYKPEVSSMPFSALSEVLETSEELQSTPAPFQILPDILEANSTSGGVKYIKSALRILDEPGVDLTYAQERLEHDSYVAALERFKDEMHEFETKTNQIALGNIKFSLNVWIDEAKEVIQKKAEYAGALGSGSKI